MKQILITGPTGAIGRGLIQYSLDQGTAVTAVCHKNSKRAKELPDSPLLEVVSCDLSEIGRLPELTGHRGFDCVYHLAWDGTFGNTRNNMPGQVQNIRYTLDVCQVAADLGSRKFVFAGSQAEYGRVSEPLKPDTPCFPENGYGMAKLCAAQMSRGLCEQLSMEHVEARILSVYGPHDGPYTMIMSVIRSLLKGEKPSLSAGEQIWDYLYEEDAARALYLMGEKGVSGSIYPLGSGEARPLKSYVEKLRDQIDPKLPLGFGEIPYGNKQVMHLTADLSALTKDTGFTPQITFDEGIRRTIEKVTAAAYMMQHGEEI